MRELTVYVIMIGIAVVSTVYVYFAWMMLHRKEQQDFPSARSGGNGGGATKRPSKTK
jgi:hypothetical protein